MLWQQACPILTYRQLSIKKANPARLRHEQTTMADNLRSKHWDTGWGYLKTAQFCHFQLLCFQQNLMRKCTFYMGTWTRKCRPKNLVFSERELMFTFAICRRASVCLSSVVCLSVVCNVRAPYSAIEIFGNVSAPRNTLVIWRHPGKILRRSSQGTPPSGG